MGISLHHESSFRKEILQMHHKILKHLLSLFFVLVLLTAMGLQWAVIKKGPNMKEAMQQEAEYYRFIMPKFAASPENEQVQIKIY